jgi:TIR domain
MKPIAACEFTAFISYAHADDDLCAGWVTQFRNELDRGLRAMTRGTRLPPLHMSGENGPVAGVLSDELIKRIDVSFAMVIIVADNYVQSSWCLKELAYFKTLFGEQGFRERLYIVALSESAIFKISSCAAWKELMPTNEQVWMPFFNDIERDKCIKVYMQPNVLALDFQAPFERLRGDFADKLRHTVDAPVLPMPPVLNGTAASNSPALAASTTAAKVQIGFVPPACAAAVAAAAQALVRQGVPVRQLALEVVYSDFEDLLQAEHLVLPFDDSPLTLTNFAAGGHLQVQREAWLKKGKPADKLLWLDLRERMTLPRDWQGAAAYVATLNVAPLNLQGLISALLPAPVASSPAPSQGVRLYIESNSNERTLWEPLGEQIRRKWDRVCGQIAPGRVPPLSLRTRGLPVDQLDHYPSLDDADGVVLLWGRKTPDTLMAQINKVENKMPFGREAAPGIVAYLMPPQPTADPMPAWGWQVLRFNAADEQGIDVVADEGDELDRFLKRVFARRELREQRGAAALA